MLGSSFARANPLQLAINEFKQRPLTFKVVTSAIGFSAGDALAQFANRPKNLALRKSWKFDVKRSAGMAAAGGLIAGPVGLQFLNWMEVHIMPHASTR